MKLRRLLFLFLASAALTFGLTGCRTFSVSEDGTLGRVLAEAGRLRDYILARQAEASEPAAEETRASGVTTILLIGSDRRDTTWYGNADTMMLLSVNHDKQTVSLISLMRDIGADIPGRGYDKMNAALAIGGPQLAVRTIAQNFQVGIDAYIFVDFGGMIRIVDLFGGVGLQVSDDEANVMNEYIREHCRLFGYDEASNLMPSGGFYTLNGVRTVAYCRNRYTGNNDFERTARQRRVLGVLYEKMRAMSFAELVNMAQQILPSVQTDLSLEAIQGLIPAVIQSGYAVVMDRVPYDGLYSYGEVNLDPAWYETIIRLQSTLY